MHLLHTIAPFFRVLKDLVVGAWVDYTAQGTNPPSPPAGFVRHHAATTQGFTRLEQDNEAATNLVLGRDNVFIGRNTTGTPMTKGQCVYVNGSTGNVPNIALAKADSATTLPAVGIVLDPIADNAFGQVMKLGILASFNTSSYSTGATLFVSTSVAGAFQDTVPVAPNYSQKMAVVLVSGIGNGSMLIVTGSDVHLETAVAGDFDSLITGTSTIAANKVRTIGGRLTIADGGVLIIEDTGALALI